jgi:hypothetical protein
VTKVRPETEADHEQAAAVHVLAWQRGYAGVMPDDVLANLDSAEMAKRRANREGTSLVAEHEGRIVGFVTYGSYRGDENRGEIYAIYVPASPTHCSPRRSTPCRSHACTCGCWPKTHGRIGSTPATA